MAATFDATHQPAPGLRERKKEHTRVVIRDAGRALFAQQGFEATTVAQIAEAAGVGLRTFYRYYPSKEHVAVEELRRFTEDGVELIKARPADESPIDSIVAVIDTLSQRAYTQSMALDVALVETIPSVAGVQHHLIVAAQDALTDLFAARLGVPEHSLEPRLHAAAATLAYHAATRTWVRQVAAGLPESDVDVWELGRQALVAYSDGLQGRAVASRARAVKPPR